MNLHAKNVAVQAGIPNDLINQTVFFMKTRNKINTRTAQLYLKSHQHFVKTESKSSKKDLSSFYVEIFEDFLPEPLVLTILMDAPTPQTFHLSI